MHCINAVFQPSNPADVPARKEPISVKKLGKGDASWQTHGRILGWDVNTLSKTLHLPEHRRTDILDRINRATNQRRTPKKEWEKLLGCVRNAVFAIQGGIGHLSLAQSALSTARRSTVTLTNRARSQLRTIASFMSSKDRPSHWSEIVPQRPAVIGACDAAKSGMGGVIFGSDTPLVWRSRFPTHVQDEVVSFDNPAGAVTNSDLELAGTIAQEATAASIFDVKHSTIHTFCNNTPAIAWRRKGARSTLNCGADLLAVASRLHRSHAFLPTLQHIAGEKNQMADDASCCWDLSNSDFLSHFD